MTRIIVAHWRRRFVGAQTFSPTTPTQVRDHKFELRDL